MPTTIAVRLRWYVVHSQRSGDTHAARRGARGGAARRGAWGGAARRGTTAAAAVGPGGEGGSPKRLYKALTDNTKPQQTIQSFKNTIQSTEMLDKDINIKQELQNKHQVNLYPFIYVT